MSKNALRSVPTEDVVECVLVPCYWYLRGVSVQQRFTHCEWSKFWTFWVKLIDGEQMRVNSSERLHLKTSIDWRIDDLTKTKSKVQGKKVRAQSCVRLLLKMERFLPVHNSRASSLLGEPVYVRNSKEKFNYLHTKQRPLWLHTSFFTYFNQPLTINNIAAHTRAWHRKSSYTHHQGFVWGRRQDVSSGRLPFYVRYFDANMWGFF